MGGAEMSEWPKVKLKELMVIKNGKDHKALLDGEYPVYGSGGIMRYVNKYLYDKESVLLPRKGTLNNIQFATFPFWTVDTCYYTEVKNEKVLPYFLYLSICQLDIAALNTGSAVPSMTFDKYYSIEINLPPLPVQRRIAEILSRYDSLIENYQRQIKLLEEAAQRLYKEWFVDLHFPGHENTPIIDGIPEGWEKKKLGEVFTYVRGKSYTSKELSNKGTIMVNLKNIQAFGGYNRNAEKRFTGDYKEMQALEKGDLIMGVTDMTKERRLVGHVALVPDFNERATFSMDLIKIVPFELPKVYLYCAMRFGGISTSISPLANGVNVLHLKPDALTGIEMIVPNKVLIQNFSSYASSCIEEINNIEDQIRNLTEARDRLLPKLMSGEIDIV